MSGKGVERSELELLNGDCATSYDDEGKASGIIQGAQASVRGPRDCSLQEVVEGQEDELSNEGRNSRASFDPSEEDDGDEDA